jgi:hypothetical protein
MRRFSVTQVLLYSLGRIPVFVRIYSAVGLQSVQLQYSSMKNENAYECDEDMNSHACECCHWLSDWPMS